MQRLLLPFLLVAITSVSSHALSSTPWEINEERQDDKWTLNSGTASGDPVVYISVDGQITRRDRLRLLTLPADNCKDSMLVTSFYTPKDSEKLKQIKDQQINIGMLGGEVPAMLMRFDERDGNHFAWIEIVFADVVGMRDILTRMVKNHDTMEVTLKPTRTFKTDKYFETLTNKWSLAGVVEAFDKSVMVCRRMNEDTII